MADVLNKPQDDDNDENSGMGGASPQVAAFSPLQSSYTSQGQPSPNTTLGGAGVGGRSQQAGTGRFTNIQKYINANKGADVAGGIQQKIGGEASKIGESINAQKQQFNQSVNPDEQTYAQAGQLRQQALANPTDFTQNEENLNKYQELRTGQLQFDPTKQEQFQTGLSNTAAQSQQAQDLANMANSEQGRFQLLQKTYGMPTYNKGQQRLDQLLLQGNPNQLKGLVSSSQQAQKGLADLTGSTQSEIQSRLAALNQQAQENRAGVASELGDENTKTGAFGELFGGLESKASTTNAQNEAMKNEAAAYLSGTKSLAELSPQVQQALSGAKQFGGDSDIAKNTINQYLTAAQQANIQNVAGQEDLARYQALNKLAGTQGQTLTSDSLANTPKLSENPFGLDINAFNQAKKSGFINSFDPLIKQAANQWDAINRSRYAHNGARVVDSDVDRALKASYEQYLPQFQQLASQYGLGNQDYGFWSRLGSSARGTGEAGLLQNFYNQA